MKKSIFILIAVVCLSATTTFAQEKPYRIGLKFGMPNLAGLNVEYATPVKFAPTLDFSSISASFGDAKVSFNYIEVGTNYYFKEEAKGFYGHLSYGRIGFKGTYDDPSLGEGEGKVGLSLANLKIGAKFGNGFYFRPEIGYGILLGDPKVKVEYNHPENGKTTEEESVPGALAGGFLFNLGFGVAFGK